MPILGSIIARGSEPRLSLANGQLLRRLAIGNSWHRIRIGIRCGFNPLVAGNLSNPPRLYMGVCNYDRGGVGSVLGSPTFVGMAALQTGGWARNTAATPDSYSVTSYQYVTMGSTGTNASVVSTTLTPTVEPDAFLCMLSVDIDKTNPAVPVVGTFGPANSVSGVYDVTFDAFITAMESTTPSMSNYTYDSDSMPLQINEGANGVLDAVNLMWTRTSCQLEIADLYFSVIS